MQTKLHLSILTVLSTLLLAVPGCLSENELDTDFRELAFMKLYHPGAQAGDSGDDCLIWDIKDDTDTAVYDPTGGQVMDVIDATGDIEAGGTVVCNISGKNLYDDNGRLIYKLQGNKIKNASNQVVMTFSGAEVLDPSGSPLVEADGNIPPTDDDHKLVIGALVGAKCGSAGIP